MRFIPKRPTLEEIIARYGSLKDYLNDPEQIELNNGKNYHDIMLLFDESIAAVARQTKRNRKTVYRWQTIHEKEKSK